LSKKTVLSKQTARKESGCMPFISFPVHKYLHLHQEEKTGGRTQRAFLHYLSNSCFVFMDIHWRQPSRNVPVNPELIMT
jgi:hypothetical protein